MGVLLHATSIAVGAAVAVSAVAVHRSVVFHLPLGLLLGLATTFVTSWAIRERWPRLSSSYAAGWIVAFGFVIAGKREGDYAVAGDVRGYVLMTAGLVLLVVGVASLPSRNSSSTPRAA